MTSLPKRSKKFGIGKEIGGAIYVHREYENTLPTETHTAKKHLPTGSPYTIVKFAFSSKATSFIHSPDFDSADEPTVGDILLISWAGEIRQLKAQRDPFIYHHKWLFVADDYSGFDVEASKLRSQYWLALENVDKKRIGRQSYWHQHVLPRLSEKAWYRSPDACRILGVSSCELAHLRNAGKLRFRKEGNAFLYKIDSDNKFATSGTPRECSPDL